MDISGCLPVVGTYTSHMDGTEDTFEILSISWGIDTSEPIFFGQEVNGAGHITGQCCERYVGSMMVTWTPQPENVEYTALMYIFVGVVSDIASGSEVYMRFFKYFGAESGYPYFFRWFNDTTIPTGGEPHLCSIKRGGWTTLGNTQLADYGSTLTFITESDGYEIEVIPAYGNDDGAYLHPGTGNDAQNAVDLADLTRCQNCSTVEDYKITVSGLSALCIGGDVEPSDDAVELTFSIPGGILNLDPTAEPTVTGYSGIGANCSGDPGNPCFDPTNLSEVTVDASLDFSDTPFTGTKTFRVFLVIVGLCDGVEEDTVSGFAHFNVTCSGGIISDPQGVSIGGQTITIDVEPV